MKNLISLIVVALFSTNSFATGMARADFGYVMDQEKSGSVDTTNTRQIIEFAGGFMWPAGIALFGQYATETITATSGGSTTTSTRTSYGPGLGWYARSAIGGYITGVYYFNSKLASPGTTYTGTGYQADLGLKVAVSSLVILAGLSYAGFNYTKTQAGALTPSYKMANLSPRVGVMFEF